MAGARLARVASGLLVALVAACAGGPQRIAPPPTQGHLGFYIHDPARQGDAVLVSWDGSQRSLVTLPLPRTGGRPRWTQSPDGNMLLLLDGTVVDRWGKVLTHVPTEFASWADDSRHLCAVGDIRGRYPQEVFTQTGPTSMTGT